MSAARLHRCSEKLLDTTEMVQGRKSLVRADGTKHCGRCEQWLPMSEFGVDKNAPTGVRACCKPCWAAYHRNYYFRTRGEGALRKNYKLSMDEFLAMAQRQGGVCAICGSEPDTHIGRLVVDHCHKTGRVRGLLCQNCNQGVGRFGDDPAVLHAAIRYLEGTAQ